MNPSASESTRERRDQCQLIHNLSVDRILELYMIDYIRHILYIWLSAIILRLDVHL